VIEYFVSTAANWIQRTTQLLQ